jgi:hypothetical protein
MAFRLKAGRDLGRELRRLVRDELSEAVQHLSDPAPDDAAIHDARTDVKKARAVLRLVRDELCRNYRVENERLREAVTCLSRCEMQMLQSKRSTRCGATTHRCSRGDG